MQAKCTLSGEIFDVSDHEIELRKKINFGNTLPSMLPKYRFQYLGAFWPQWNLHKRNCDKTGKPIISIFRPDCRYPVWHRDEWIKYNSPPSQDFDFSRSFFEQVAELFPKCPIPHIFQSNNQNCEYTDDWYHSKNCYLCHSGQNNEDCRYCYGCDSIKNVHGGVFSFKSEFCYDIINCSSCYKSRFLLNCKNVTDSAFLYDCRDCSDCLFCFNLRHKKYCFGNQQLSKEEFEEKKKEWSFSSYKNYEKAKLYFARMMVKKAWHRAIQIDLCENSSGNFIHHCKDCENCYMLSYHEACANTTFCGPNAKFILDSIGTVGSELSFMCSLPVYCYNTIFCFSVDNCKFVEYSAYLQNCEYCFGCCGLFRKKYCIFNKQYSKEEYEKLVPRIREHMGKFPSTFGRGIRGEDEWGQFFPQSMAPNPYNESFSGYHFPLNSESSQEFWQAGPLERINMKTAEINELPDSLESLTDEKEEWLITQVFWDDKYQRPFQIQKDEIKFIKIMNAPLPHCYYINRIQSNFKWMPFNGELRESKCAKSGKMIHTNWAKEYDERILSEEEYLKLVK